MNLLIVAFLTFFSISAQADILYLDLNFSAEEVKSIQEVARQRKEKLWIFPERTADQHVAIEQRYRELDRLERQYRNCQPQQGPRCKEIADSIKGTKNALDSLIAPLRQITPSSLQQILRDFSASGISLSGIVFSGHSGGNGQFAGHLGRLEFSDIQVAFDRYPAPVENTSFILLWGCYSGNLHSLANSWRKNFPQVKLFAGFEKQSPLGIRKTSGQLLKGVLQKEAALLAARNKSELHRIYKSINLVAELDSTALVSGYFMSYDHIDTVEEMLKRCDSFDPRLFERFECFEEGKAGCENPPSSHQGDLRTLYSFLQVNRHCGNALLEKYPGLPTPEYLVRLIFLDNVKKNMVAHHGARFSVYSRALADAGLPASLGFDRFRHSTRAEDIESDREIQSILVKRGFRDFSAVERPDWRILYQVQNTVNASHYITGPSYFRTLPLAHCVPFSWVEPETKEKDNCGLSELLSSPLVDSAEQQITGAFFDIRLLTYMGDHFQVMDHLSQSPVELEAFKAAHLQRLKAAIDFARATPDRSALEEARLTGLTDQYLRRSWMSPPELITTLIGDAHALQVYLENERARILSEKHNGIALEKVEFHQTFLMRWLALLRGLSGR